MKMKTIIVELKDKSYKILIKSKLLSTVSTHLKSLKLGKKILIITQDKVPKSYTNTLKQNLEHNGYNVFTLVLKSGENHKDLKSLLTIIANATKNKFERNDTFCALGGGVISDLAGFAASIYYRGLNFISIPTTLLGMVDAAIGGKTAVNIKEGKNLLGTFYQPRIVIIDPSTLRTLKKREVLVGMGEVIKYGLLEKSAGVIFPNMSFIKYLKENKLKILNLSESIILNIISHSANIKAHIVSKDEKESGIRAILNLGHTFAHGIEQAYDYKTYTHGEAVSIGMCLAAKLAFKHQLISISIQNEIINLISDFGLPTTLQKTAPVDKIFRSMLHDKKVKDGKLKFILPHKEIGKVKVVSDIDLKEIKDLLTN